jgi:ABC-type multidrug transport system fused ATPase/permease subunit
MAPASSSDTLSGAWGEARRLLWSHRRPLALGFVLMGINRAAALVLPASSKFLIDDVVGAGRTELLVWLALAVAMATLVQAGSSFGVARVVHLAAHRVVARMRLDLQRHVLRLPIGVMDERRSGELVARIMRDPEGAAPLIGSAVLQLLGGMLTAALALGVLLYLNVPLTLAVLGVVALYLVVLGYSFRKLQPIFRARRATEADVAARLTEALVAVRVLKVYGAERREANTFARGIHHVLRLTARADIGHSLLMAFSIVAKGAAGVLLLVLGGRALLAAEMTVGELVMFVFFLGLFAAPLVQIASISAAVAESRAGLERMRELRDAPAETEADRVRLPVREVVGDVAFEDVSFAYPGGEPVLNEVSFRAQPGSLTALVGPSGAGKTTIVNLIMGFHHPARGRVLIDGRDLASLRIREYRTHLAAVLQQDLLFDGTIRENIGFARPRAPLEAELEAARLARSDEFANRLGGGYETVVGERGVRLSAGQRQRIAIARAILADPRILVLDEALSELDSENEALVREGLRRLLHGRTSFIIAHRLATILEADEILVVEGGRIVERGTHLDLLAGGGRYRDLFELQFGAAASVAPAR